MAEVKVSIQCEPAEAVALKAALSGGAREAALAIARLCKGAACGTKEASVSEVPEPAPAPAPAKKAPAKRASK